MERATPESAPPGLLTDLYQLTMAAAYARAGIGSTDACFHLYFRDNPFGGGFTVAAGLERAIEYLVDLHFTPADTAYLATLTGRDGNALFDTGFLAALEHFRFSGSVIGLSYLASLLAAACARIFCATSPAGGLLTRTITSMAGSSCSAFKPASSMIPPTLIGK